MGMLAAECDYVIGVDTHRDTHTYAICDPAGREGAIALAIAPTEDAASR